MNLVDEIAAGLKSNQSLISDSVPSRSRSSKSVVYVYLVPEWHNFLILFFFWLILQQIFIEYGL